MSSPPYLPEDIIKKIPLRAYLDSPTIFTRGKTISRHLLIKYVANKLGGSHHDIKREKDAVGMTFATLDKLAKDDKLEVSGHPAVYYELLAIGQAVVQSPDIQRFLDATAKGASPSTSK